MGCGSNLQNTTEDMVNIVKHPIKLKQEVIAIIGCTHAGTTAAVILRNLNKNVRILVFEKTSTVSFLSCGIHLAINKTCDDLNRLFYNTPNRMKQMGIEIHECTSVEGVDFNTKQINTIDLNTNEKQSFQYHKMIISTGSNPQIPPVIDGIDYQNDPANQLRTNFKRILLCKTYQDAQRLVKLQDPKKVCIIGSGHIGMELAWSFNVIGSKVTIVDHQKHILQKYFDYEYVNILEKECKILGIDLCPHSKVVKLKENESSVAVCIERNVDEIIKVLNAEFDYVIVCTGFVPNTKNLIGQSQNKLTNLNNVIVVDNQQRTSIENVFAIGDCATCYNRLLKKQAHIPLASQAVKQGIVAANQALGRNLTASGSNQTYGIQLFDYSLASTGLTTMDAKKQCRHVGKVIQSDYLWSAYCQKKVAKVVQKLQELGKQFSDREEIVQKMCDKVVDSFEFDSEQTEDELVSVIIIFDEDTNVILGCQVMGKQDITQIVNTASIAIQMGMTIDQLAYQDLGGFDGETKPWGVLQTAAASAIIPLPDFDDTFEDSEMNIGKQQSVQVNDVSDW
ncbi:NADH_oxidase [Hexamita inflata]|uniref:NADH oxidase n=1 Tax=Hexamita inflata TaxID=28002 RepID=A0AA86RJU9_9EUKA|nr:NADH oxidase [Hexamita inflata]